MLDSGDWDSIAVVKCAVEDYHYSAFDHSVVEVGEGLPWRWPTFACLVQCHFPGMSNSLSFLILHHQGCCLIFQMLQACLSSSSDHPLLWTLEIGLFEFGKGVSPYACVYCPQALVYWRRALLLFPWRKRVFQVYPLIHHFLQ